MPLLQTKSSGIFIFSLAEVFNRAYAAQYFLPRIARILKNNSRLKDLNRAAPILKE